jgi:hypothetical protein
MRQSIAFLLTRILHISNGLAFLLMNKRASLWHYWQDVSAGQRQAWPSGQMSV